MPLNPDELSPEEAYKRRTADVTTAAGLQNAGFGGAPIEGTIAAAPGNVRQNLPNGDIVNFKPFRPAGGGAVPFDPSTVLGPAPVVAPAPGTDSTTIAGRWGDTSSPEYQDQLRQHNESLKQVSDYLDVSHALAAQHEDALSKADAADFLGSVHEKLDPTSPTYERDFADLMAAHPRAASNAGVRDIVSALHSARGVHLKHAEAGGAGEFGGVAQDVYKDTFTETKDSAQARAAAKDVHDAFTSGAVTYNDLWYNSEKDHSDLYTDDGRPNVSAIRQLAEQRRGEMATRGAEAKVGLAESRAAAADARTAKLEAGNAPRPQQGDADLLKNYPLGSKKLFALDQQIAAATDPGVKAGIQARKDEIYNAHKRALGLRPDQPLPGQPAAPAAATPAGTPAGTPAPKYAPALVAKAQAALTDPNATADHKRAAQRIINGQ